jgi:FAD:protein FMN transferase
VQLNRMMIAQSENYGMSTVINNRVFGEKAEKALQAALKEIRRLEGMLSRFIPSSEISRINNSAGYRYEKVSSETYEVLSQAVEFSKYSQGCFDVTIGPLVNLWAGVKDKSNPPDESKIRDIVPFVNYTDLVLDPGKKTVGLKKSGQSIDLGGIGKGFAADMILEVFKKYEVSSAFTNFGGNVAAIGAKPDGYPWNIGIQHPRKENSLIGVVSVVNKSVVTSGDYQRYFIGRDGKRYHHILNPNTGYPSESGLISVTIVADSSTVADALSTILFVTGMNKGIELLKSFPGTEAILIDMNLLVHVTQGLKYFFQAEEGINIELLS